VDGFTAEEVDLFTRLAADKADASKMDRPEDIEPNPVNGRIYAAPTNNTDRGAAGKAGVDEANQRNNNKNGHILEWEEAGGVAAATKFSWRLLLLCGAGLRRIPTSAASRKIRSAPSPARTTSLSTPVATCGSPPTGTRSGRTTVCSRCRSRDRNAVT
jgi:secreted PhoX family phosphatase